MADGAPRRMGIYPSELINGGLPPARRAIAERWQPPRHSKSRGRRVAVPEVEAAVYFCCSGA
jgi:hypothetical protein